MTLSSNELAQQLNIYEFRGRKVSFKALERLLPDVETALFFAKLYELDYRELSELLKIRFRSTVIAALSGGEHSTELQDYIVDTVPEDVMRAMPRPPEFVPDLPPKGEILPQLWEAASLQIAASIKEVAEKLGDVLDHLPSKEGEMLFKTMATLNRQRPTIGDYKATIFHKQVTQNLVILDVSGSMSESTIRKIVDDVVALSWKANATLAIVSDNTFVWDPATFDTTDVLHAAEYNGTHYETLHPLLNQDWNTVITIADYDSSRSAKRALSRCTGRIGRVLDISLVNKPTFLAECVGQLADEVEPLLIAHSYRVLSA